MMHVVQNGVHILPDRPVEVVYRRDFTVVVVFHHYRECHLDINITDYLPIAPVNSAIPICIVCDQSKQLHIIKMPVVHSNIVITVLEDLL